MKPSVQSHFLLVGCHCRKQLSYHIWSYKSKFGFGAGKSSRWGCCVKNLSLAGFQDA